MAFWLAVIVELVTLAAFFVIALGNPIAPDPKRDPSPWPVLIVGTAIALTIAFI